MNLVSAGGAALWTGAELLGIVAGTWLGAAEVAMACRMRAGQPRLLLGLTVAIQGTMLAVALILAAFLVTVGGSLLELLALGSLPSPAQRAGSAGEPAGYHGQVAIVCGDEQHQTFAATRGFGGEIGIVASRRAGDREAPRMLCDIVQAFQAGDFRLQVAFSFSNTGVA